MSWLEPKYIFYVVGKYFKLLLVCFLIEYDFGCWYETAYYSMTYDWIIAEFTMLIEIEKKLYMSFLLTLEEKISKM